MMRRGGEGEEEREGEEGRRKEGRDDAGRVRAG
jgi:hypothetical protein